MLKTMSRSFSLMPAHTIRLCRRAISARRRTLGPSGTGSASSHVFGVQWPWTTSSGNRTSSAPAAATFSHQASMEFKTRSGSPRNPFMLTAATRVVLKVAPLWGLIAENESTGPRQYQIAQSVCINAISA